MPDPVIEVDDWLERLCDMLDRRGPPGRAHQAYDLLALAAKLRRVRPELLAERGGGQDLARAEAAIGEKGRDLVRLALTIPNPEGWLEEARALAESYEDLIDPVRRAELAENLLADLDDAELVAYAARRLGAGDAELDRELEACAQWVTEHADAFLAASVHVQAVGLALRPDLAEWDPALARTAEKYKLVLDALEAAEAELSFANQPRMDPAAVRYLFSLARKKVLAFPASWLVERESAAAIAAAGARSEVPRPARLLKWASPDGTASAYLVIPEQFAGGEGREAVAVTFFQADGRPAVSLAGQAVALASVPMAIDESARAEFDLGRLRAAGQDLMLEVGPDRIPWIPEAS